MLIEKEEFDKQVEGYKRTGFYTGKSEAYRNGFKDALSLAWGIVSDYASNQPVERDRASDAVCTCEPRFLDRSCPIHGEAGTNPPGGSL